MVRKREIRIEKRMTLDKYLGKYVTVEGNVDGVRADENGHTINYVLEADVIG